MNEEQYQKAARMRREGREWIDIAKVLEMSTLELKREYQKRLGKRLRGEE